jgi:hypothetical protein
MQEAFESGSIDALRDYVNKLPMEEAKMHMVGTYPKRHAHMLAKVPKIPPKYPKARAQMLAKVPKMPRNYPKLCSACPYSVKRMVDSGLWVPTPGSEPGEALQ